MENDELKQLEWVPRDVKVRSYQLGDEPEMIHIIRTGFVEGGMAYLVVYEDAFELTLGNTKLMSAEQIKEIYGIDV